MLESVSDRTSYITLKGCWCDIIVLNVHAAPTENKDDIKDSFYEEPEQVIYQFPRHHMKILLGDFNAKVGSMHKASKNNSVRVVYFPSLKNLIVKSTTFPHRDIKI
jgi:hypothetical protein